MHDDGFFDESIAATYDDYSAGMFAPEIVLPVVDFLADLAGDGSVLEFGVGTGRIALPLADRGVEVHGIDLSMSMVQRLRAKPGADAIEVTIGDIAHARVDKAFALVYLVFSTIGNLIEQEQQVACFCNAAAHLEPGGCFVIEVGVPDLRSLPPGTTRRVFQWADDRWGIDDYRMAEQMLTSHHFWRQDGAIGHASMPYRYVWPAELDLMARIAGLRLRERWGGWNREPFTDESEMHVSVWEKPG
jgi:SAM-dependent methyltransferase